MSITYRSRHEGAFHQRFDTGEPKPSLSVPRHRHVLLVNVTQDLKQQLWTGFAQDKDALEAIQARYDALGPDRREVSVKQMRQRCRREIFSRVSAKLHAMRCDWNPV